MIGSPSGRANRVARTLARWVALASVIACLSSASIRAVAQSLVPPAPDPKQDSIRELRRELEQRDAVIASLLARVEQLERTVALSRGDLDRIIAGGAGPSPGGGTRPVPQPGAQAVAAAVEPSASESSPTRSDPAGTGQQAAPVSQDQGAAQQGGPKRQETAQAEAPAPGQFEVDEEAAERALDFTLVEEGALLLPFGRAEVTPSFTYTRRTDDFPVVVNLDQSARRAGGAAERVRVLAESAGRVSLEFPARARGCPTILSTSRSSQGRRRRGPAIVPNGPRPGRLLGRARQDGAAGERTGGRTWSCGSNWDTGTGERENNDVVLDGGFQELTGSVSLIKRQDPLVFVGGAFYEWASEQDDIDPGDPTGSASGRSSPPAPIPR